MSTPISKLPPQEDYVPDYSNWVDVVERIRTGDASGMEEMYADFSRSVRFQFLRQLGIQDLDDKVHDVFIIVAEAEYPPRDLR